MRAFIGAALAFAAVTRGAAAQNETALRQAFEGRTVAVRIAMPATSQGVDVFPNETPAVNFRDVAERLKDNGTALKMGEQVMVTKVVVKKNSHIEFQLGGGGYGTFGDYVSGGSDVSAVSAGETAEERSLREAIKRETDKGERKRLERELDGVRSARQRENARGQAEAQQANMAREANLRSKRAESGSRFNIRFRQGIPPEMLTADGVMRALAHYVTFADAPVMAAATPAPAGPGTFLAATAGPTPVAAVVPAGGTRTLTAASHEAAPAAAAAPAAGGIGALHKGLTLAEVEAAMGPATSAGESKDGSMTVMKRTYKRDGMQVVASFVSGVLVDFAITPQ